MLARDLLPGAAPSLPWAPPLAAFAVGLAVLFGFALPPLLRLRDVEPMRVFRQDVGTRAAPLRRAVPAAVRRRRGADRFEAGNVRLALTLGGGFLRRRARDVAARLAAAAARCAAAASACPARCVSASRISRAVAR